MAQILSPIDGYYREELVSLEKALELIQSKIIGLTEFIKVAKKYCYYPNEHELTRDESASIFIYTMEWGETSLYHLLNEALTNKDREKIKLWFPYLKLFDTALNKLPTVQEVIYRSIPSGFGQYFQKDQLITWWNISLCSLSLNVVENTMEYTLFKIEALNGKNVSGYTENENKDEVILRMGTQFRVTTVPLDLSNGSYVVHVIEIDNQDEEESSSTECETDSDETVSSTQPTNNIDVPISNDNRSKPSLKLFRPFRFLFKSLKPHRRESLYGIWEQSDQIVAGGNGVGNELNQLSLPHGIFIDENKNIYIADYGNHRIMKWTYGAEEGEIAAGGNGRGNRMDQLNNPTHMILKTEDHSLIIADRGNKRVIRWFNQNHQEILVENIDCYGLAMDKYGYLYVSDYVRNEVRRWKLGEKGEGIVVASGNQVRFPTFIFVDEEQSVYVSDSVNDHVIKWTKDANEGVIVAGGYGRGNNLNQLYEPQGLIIDHYSQIYVVDQGNNRIMRWCEGKEKGEILFGLQRRGKYYNGLYCPSGLTYDLEGNIYVADCANNRILKFS